jgi:HK97 family phage prohead protease
MKSVAIIEPTMMNRASIPARIKFVEGDTLNRIGRTITGYATTPDVDRMGDTVDPAGAIFKLPIPLLFNHDSMQPVGQVTSAQVTPQGIQVVAKLTSGIGRVDELWQLITQDIINGLSIGFRGLKQSPLPGGGIAWKSWEWLELSVCTVPANAAAGFTVLRGMPDAGRTAPKSKGVRLITPKRESVKLITASRRSVKLVPLKRAPVKLIGAHRGSAVKLIPTR